MFFFISFQPVDKFLNLIRAGQTVFVFLLAAASLSCATATGDSGDGIENRLRDAGNEAALSAARRNIEIFRKGDARIKIVDAQNNPVSSATVRIKQISHDFKFGCYLKIDDLAPEKLPEYERHFARLFNFAVVGTYWDFIENTRGHENWSWFERETALAKKLNARIEAAPVLWGTNEAGTPAWLPRERNELDRILKRRVQTVLTRYQNVAQDWEIVNEPLAPKPDVFAERAGADYVARAFFNAREVAPNARLMINEYGVFGSVARHNYNREKYLNYVRGLLNRNVPVDVVGIQAHANGEWYEPANVAAELERYAALGKPIQITEFSSQMFEYDDRTTPLRITGNYRAGVWDAGKQAEFYREFYTVVFGNPNVEALTTWGLDDERAWLPGIGLIGADGRPKAAYQTLDRLLNQEWRTTLSGAANSEGIYEFRGFYGDYEITATASTGRTTRAEFALEKGKTNEWTIRLGS